MSVVNELEHLISKGTPGPWSSDKDEVCIYGVDEGEFSKIKTMCDGGYKADALLIVTLRNAAPDLLRVVKAVAAMDPMAEMHCIFCGCDEFGPRPHDHAPDCTHALARTLTAPDDGRGA